MVAEQRETVQRIDADTQDIMSNVGWGSTGAAQVLREQFQATAG